MARHKEFDRDIALRSALGVFWRKGYEATSTDDLLSAMQIGRQSLYDTFGDKQSLYLETLRCYHKLNNENFFGHLSAAPTPLQTLHAILSVPARMNDAERARGCMGINATTAHGQANPEVTALARRTAEVNHALLARHVRAAQACGELAASVDADKAARFLYATLQGLTVRGQAGADPRDLAEAADFAMEAIKAMH